MAPAHRSTILAPIMLLSANLTSTILSDAVIGRALILATGRVHHVILLITGILSHVFEPSRIISSILSPVITGGDFNRERLFI